MLILIIYLLLMFPFIYSSIHLLIQLSCARKILFGRQALVKLIFTFLVHLEFLPLDGLKITLRPMMAQIE